MKRAYLHVLALTLLALPVQASLVMSGGTDQALPIAGNSYNTDLDGLGFDTMRTSGQLSVSADGFVDFYFIGAESGFSNTFAVKQNPGGPVSSITEPANNFETFTFGGIATYPVITIAVTAGEVLDFKFSNDTNSNVVNNFTSSRLFDLGLVYDSSATTLNQLVLAYDDQFSSYGIDDNHDDMLIRADFRPVPVPAAAWLFGSGLLGLVGVARRNRAA